MFGINNTSAYHLRKLSKIKNKNTLIERYTKITRTIKSQVEATIHT